MPRRTIRLSAETDERVRAMAKVRGFANPSVFLRAAIERELKGREEAVLSLEERLASTAEQIRREILGLKQSQQALFAFVDSLAKILLTCIPEPDGKAMEAAVLSAQGGCLLRPIMRLRKLPSLAALPTRSTSHGFSAASTPKRQQGFGAAPAIRVDPEISAFTGSMPASLCRTPPV